MASEAPASVPRDEEKGVQPAKNPEEGASWWEIVTLNFMSPLLQLGSTRPLVFEDVGGVLPVDESERVYRRFEGYWNDQVTRHGPQRASLAWALLQTAGVWTVLGAVLLNVLSGALQFGNPVLLNILLLHFQGDTELSDTELWLAVAGLLVLPSLASVLQTRHNFVMVRVGLVLKTVASIGVFEKALRLRDEHGEFTKGSMVTLLSVDAQQMGRFPQLVALSLTAPMMIVVAFYLLTLQVGVSTWAGAGLMAAFVPVSAAMFITIARVRRRVLKLTTERTSLMNDVLNGVRIVKMFAWERPFIDRVNEVRKREMAEVRYGAYIVAVGFSLVLLSLPSLLPLVVFADYTQIRGNELTPSRAFSTIALFGLLRFPFSFLPMSLLQIAVTNISLERVRKVFTAPEVKPSDNLENRPDLIQTAKEQGLLPKTFDLSVSSSPSASVAAVLAHATFKWDETRRKTQDEQKKIDDDAKKSKKSTPAKTSSDEEQPQEEAEESKKPTLEDLSLCVRRGELLAVVGRVGAGKSSFLHSLLGEIPQMDGDVAIDRSGGVALAAQTPWVLNQTLKENIVFGRPVDDDWFRRVVHACQLEPDLAMLPAAEFSEIGERGITLSGGQKARVSIARAVYSRQQVVLMDDILAAVDAHVGAALFDQVICGELADRTRVLVTNQLQFVDRCDRIAVLEDGKLVSIGTPEEVRADGWLDRVARELSEDTKKNPDEQDQEEEEVIIATADGIKKRRRTVSDGTQDDETDTPAVSDAEMKKRGRLTQAEERATGSVDFGAYAYYASAAGVGLAVIVVCFQLLTKSAEVTAAFWIARWSDAAEAGSSETLSVDQFLYIYIGITLSGVVFVTIRALVLALARTQASEVLHERLLQRVLRAPTSFFDSVAMGRVISRFSGDIERVDEQLGPTFGQVLGTFAAVLGALVAMCVSTYGAILVLLVPLILFFNMVQIWFRRSSTELQRLESLSRSPIYGSFSQALAGVVTIRAYGELERFMLLNRQAVDANNAVYLLTQRASDWLSLRLDFFAALLSCSIAAFAAGTGLVPAGWVGVALTQTFEISAFLKHLVRMIAVAESQMNSVERIREYAENITPEAPARRPEALTEEQFWKPREGQVKFQDVQLRYERYVAKWDAKGSATANPVGPADSSSAEPSVPPLVLKGVTFTARPGEKLAVVGRTGAGKSTLAVALFRLVEVCGGRILIDGQDLSELGLDEVRLGISIIPQDPVLFSTSIRDNVDPFHSVSDEEVAETLRLVGLPEDIAKDVHRPVAEEGSNLSLGQKQLLCLARAIIRKPKVLLMDEATASVDEATDELVQIMVRKHFADATVITIAHRLNTVMDSDRCLVMEDGKVAEIDHPAILLNDTEKYPTSKLRDMVDRHPPNIARALRAAAQASYDN